MDNDRFSTQVLVDLGRKLRDEIDALIKRKVLIMLGAQPDEIAKVVSIGAGVGLIHMAFAYRMCGFKDDEIRMLIKVLVDTALETSKEFDVDKLTDNDTLAAILARAKERIGGRL